MECIVCHKSLRSNNTSGVCQKHRYGDTSKHACAACGAYASPKAKYCRDCSLERYEERNTYRPAKKPNMTPTPMLHELEEYESHYLD